MSPRSRPLGKTFKERWPHEVEETRYLASTTYAVVLGGVAGVFLVPLMISSWLYTLPVLVVLIAGLVAVATLAIPRTAGEGRRWLTLAWKIGAWVLAAGALGLATEAILLGRCDGDCAAAFGNRRPTPLGIPYALIVAGSAGAAFVIDRVGNALRRRTPSPASPR